MFETVVPAAASRTHRNVVVEALTFSVVVHAIAGVGAIASNIWEVTFPSAVPLATVAYILGAPSPPPPPPPPPAAQPEPVKAVAPAEIVAPEIIPDVIPVIREEIVPPIAFAVAEGVEGGVPGGVTGGVVNAEPVVEAAVQLPVVSRLPSDGRIYVARDADLPMPAISQAYPTYPEWARQRALEDELVVRYVIGKDGRVKDVTVISPPNNDVFIRPTLRAIRDWRFQPLVKDGERQEVVHELTVYYTLHYSGS